jgi:hypothetical protein
MPKKLLAILILTGLILSGCMLFPDTPATVKGSGNVVSESRQVSGITSIDLQGSAEVRVKFGAVESLVITGEDNIIFLIETNVHNHQLIINTKPLMTYSATKPVQVDVTVTSLEGVSISGSGSLDVSGYSGDALTIALPGSGELSVEGSVNDVKITLDGSGEIYADKLIASNAAITLSGSGNVTVFASEELNATISGSGQVRYSGNPNKINKNITGSGTISDSGGD